MAFNFEAFVRKQAEMPELQTVNFEQLAVDFKAVNVRIVENKEGTKFLHLIAANGDYISTKIGAKVKLTEEGTGALRELINNYQLYYGVSDSVKYSGNAYMTWGPMPSGNEPLVEISIKALMASMKASGAVGAKS